MVYGVYDMCGMCGVHVECMVCVCSVCDVCMVCVGWCVCIISMRIRVLSTFTFDGRAPSI